MVTKVISTQDVSLEINELIPCNPICCVHGDLKFVFTNQATGNLTHECVKMNYFLQGLLGPFMAVFQCTKALELL